MNKNEIEIYLFEMHLNNFLVCALPGGGGGGHSHTLPTRVCAAQRGRDFEAPDSERGVSEAFSRTGYKKLWITALSSA